MTSVEETFEIDMMNILKDTFKYFMLDDHEILKNEQDIEDDEFWINWFPRRVLRRIQSPYSNRNSNKELVSLLIVSPRARLTSDTDIREVLASYNCSCGSITENTIGDFLLYKYYELHKEQLREWALMEYAFCPK